MPYVRLDRGSLFYRRRGAGRPVVLCVHGFCQSSVYWAPMLERIAETGAAALAPDLPGFGESSGVAGPYTMENHADRLATLLDALRLVRTPSPIWIERAPSERAVASAIPLRK